MHVVQGDQSSTTKQASLELKIACEGTSRDVRQDIVAACDSIAECDLFVYFPLGKSLSNQPGWSTSAFLKTARNPYNRSKLKCASSYTVDQRF